MGLGELIVLARRMACREVQVKPVTPPSGLMAQDGLDSGDLSGFGFENFHVGRRG